MSPYPDCLTSLLSISNHLFRPSKGPNVPELPKDLSLPRFNPDTVPPPSQLDSPPSSCPSGRTAPRDSGRHDAGPISNPRNSLVSCSWPLTRRCNTIVYRYRFSVTGNVPFFLARLENVMTAIVVSNDSETTSFYRQDNYWPEDS